MNIFVGCSSIETDNEVYNETARKMGNFIVEGNHNLIFGGCDVGLMGRVYSIVSKSPKSEVFVAAAKAYEDCLQPFLASKSHIFGTINQRKDAFIALSDVAVFLPGGIGTVDELLAVIETKRAHEHNLPIIIVNEGGHFNHLLNFFEKIYDEGFAEARTRQLYFVAKTFDEAAKRLSNISK